MGLTLEIQGEYKRRPVHPAGECILTLATIEKKKITSAFGDRDEDGKVEKLIWTFQSDQTYRDEDTGDKERHEFVHFTGLRYGNEKAALTIFLNMLVPDMDEKQARSFDLEDLIGTRYQAMIRQTKDKQNPSKVYANFVYITPKKAAATKRSAAPVAAADEEEYASA